MLRNWLGATSLDAFLSTHCGTRAWAGAGVAVKISPLFSWEVLERLLGIVDIDLLVVAGGKLWDAPRPTTLPQARAMMERGLGFVLRRAELHHEGLAWLASTFTQDLPGTPHVQLFITPGGTHGFGWHYDLEEVFIVQTAGCKDYYFRENTVSPTDRIPGRLDFTPFARERSPLQTARLIEGDCLYIPARWWHMARSIEDSLSISLGVLRSSR
jgi:50S ribosomal protein L16 3-hydroxylase